MERLAREKRTAKNQEVRPESLADQCEKSGPEAATRVTSSRMGTGGGGRTQDLRQDLQRLRVQTLSFHIQPSTALLRTEPAEKTLVRTTS